MNKLFQIILFSILPIFLFSQSKLDYQYYPENQLENSDWKWKASVFWNEDENSDALTTEFFKVINKSGYINSEIINNQVDNMNDKVLTGQLRDIGFDFYLNSKNNPGKQFFHFAFQHQMNLDTDLDAGLLKLILQGNKPFAGTTIQIPYSKYTGLYFNQLKFGMGYTLETKTDGYHQFSWDLGLNLGQNYNELEILNSSIYTHPEGDFLDIAASLNTRLSDTAWAEVYDVNGIGLSTDLRYAYQKPGNFNIGLNLNNLGFIAWAGKTYNGSFDSTFRFNGLANDSTTNLPNDYSWDGLRNLIFTNSSTESFLTTLPINLQLSAGKYFSNEKFYAGINTRFYPTLKANYYLEGFFTWNYNNKLFVTPILMYSSFAKLNYGLGMGWKITEKIQIQLGSSYLNSMFNNEGLLGIGGFVKLVFVN
jgi:hypothetical protein